MKVFDFDYTKIDAYDNDCKNLGLKSQDYQSEIFPLLRYCAPSEIFL